MMIETKKVEELICRYWELSAKYDANSELLDIAITKTEKYIKDRSFIKAQAWQNECNRMVPILNDIITELKEIEKLLKECKKD